MASLPTALQNPARALVATRSRAFATVAAAVLVVGALGAVVSQARADFPAYGPLTADDAGEAFTDGHTHLVVAVDPDAGAGPSTPASGSGGPTPTPAPTTTRPPAASTTTATIAPDVLPAGFIEVPVTLVNGRLSPATMAELAELGTVTGLRQKADGSVVAVIDTRGARSAPAAAAPPAPAPVGEAALGDDGGETITTVAVAASSAANTDKTNNGNNTDKTNNANTDKTNNGHHTDKTKPEKDPRTSTTSPAATTPASTATTRATTTDPGTDDPVLARLRAIPGTVAVTRLSQGTYSVVTDADPALYRAVEGVQSILPEFVAYASSNDPLWDRQWSLDNTGSDVDGGVAGTVGADIGVTEAWPMSTGAGQVVAVIDTGIDIGHPDLASSIWRNPGEICSNQTDDDGNGYVDDCTGWDFANGDSTVYDPGSYNDHGTHVAGIIAASTNNGEGIAGIAPGARIMPLKLGNSGSFGFSAVTQAIYYAVDNGATVISASLGTRPGSVQREWISYVEDAILYARSKGVLFVAAAGNDSTDIDQAPVFPASFPEDNVISVGASNSRDGAAWFSNYGQASVDLFAPGSNILSTVPRTSSTYAYLSGTSMATPEVSASAALWLSAHRGANYQETKTALMSSDGSDGAFMTKSVSGHRVDIGQLLNPGGDGVSIAITGLADGRSDSPLNAFVQPTVSDAAAEGHASISYRASLLAARDGKAYGVVGHPVTTDYGPTATDDDSAVNLGTYSPGADPTLAFTTTLPVGAYALVAEAYDSDTGVTIGRPWASYFAVAAPGSTTPTDPYNPPATDPPTTTTTTTAPTSSSTATTAPASSTSASTGTTSPSSSTATTTTTTAPTSTTGRVTTTTAVWWDPPAPTTTTSTIPGETTARPAPPTTKADPDETSTTTTWRSNTTQPATPTTQATTTTTAAPTTTAKPSTSAPASTTSSTAPTPTNPTLPPTPPSTSNGSLVVTSVAPAYGSTNGGDVITINGSGFAGTVYVQVGGVAARSVSVASSTQLSAVTPAHAAGTVGVTVSLGDGTSVTLNGAYSYRVPDDSGSVPPPGSPITTTTTWSIDPTTTAPTTATTARPTTTTVPTTEPGAPSSTAGATTTTAPAPDLGRTRFSFGDETTDGNGLRLRPLVDGPAGLAAPSSWGSDSLACQSPSCTTYRL